MSENNSIRPVEKTQCPYPSIEEDLAAEDDAKSCVERLADELADVARPIANWGDGNCGYIIACVITALERRGLYKQSPPCRSCNIKKRVR